MFFENANFMNWWIDHYMQIFGASKANDANLMNAYVDKIKQYAVFPEVNWEMACKFGWVANLNEYCVLAALEFQRRFPEHKFSKQIKKQHKYTNDQIFEYAQNWQKLDIEKIKLFL